MKALSIGIIAENSSGRQLLTLAQHEPKEFGFTLNGKYEGKDIQIDFDSMTTSELRLYHKMIGAFLDEA